MGAVAKACQQWKTDTSCASGLLSRRAISSRRRLRRRNLSFLCQYLILIFAVRQAEVASKAWQMFTLSYTPINLHRCCQTNTPKKARKAKLRLEIFGELKEATNRHFSGDFKHRRHFYSPSFMFISTFCSPTEKKQLKSENLPEHISVWFCYELLIRIR